MKNVTRSERIFIIVSYILLGLLAVVTAYLVDGSLNPFLYFRF